MPELDAERRVALLSGRAVTLTAKEFMLFELLCVARGRLFSRDEILTRVWGLDFLGETRIVDAYVKRLRAKLGAGTIETVRGLGYRCPLPDTAQVAQPHLQRLPPEARLLTRLAERILRVTDPGHIVGSVYDLLREQYAVREVSLWALGPPAELPTLLAHAGRVRASELPLSELSLSGRPPGHRPLPGRPPSPQHDPQHDPRPAPDVAPGPLLVPLGGGSESPWALLAFWDAAGRSGWPLDVRSALDAVSALVHPALRLNAEIGRREQAEQQVRTLNAELERRVQARTHALARANADLSSLYTLAQGLAGADSLAEVLARGLSLLAQMAGADLCSLWRLHSTELHCLGAYTPGHHDRTPELAREAPTLSALLRQSVACTPAQGGLTRTASLPGGREVLLIPVATALGEVHALHFELPGPVPADLSLMDAAARAFGLAVERQVQTLMLEQVALSDELTGLPNRRALLADLAAELSYSQRYRTSLTLSLFEIPEIRAINQAQGFAAGNDLIRRLADDLRATVRLEDRVYRLGGALLCSLVRSVDVHERQVLQARLNRLSLRGVPGAAERAALKTLKISHASSPDDTSQLSDLLRLALVRLDRTDSGTQGLHPAAPTAGASRP